ncbi:hypothetical protein, partial [Oleiphilus sp. HI0080]|uniref:hypothetical protein n=1 Tax=Oleiphilus sp. HI0080 TaxID=1822255 RepID=UPI000A8E74BD
MKTRSIYQEIMPETLLKLVNKFLESSYVTRKDAKKLDNDDKLLLVHFLEGKSIFLFSGITPSFGKIDGIQDLHNPFHIASLLKLRDSGLLIETSNSIITAYITDPFNNDYWNALV